MAKGVVKAFDSDKGYGFIEKPEGLTEKELEHLGQRDIFVHYTEIMGQEGQGWLESGQIVAFRVEKVRRGLKAVEVRVILEEDLEGEVMVWRLERRPQPLGMIFSDQNKWIEIAPEELFQSDRPEDVIKVGDRVGFDLREGLVAVEIGLLEEEKEEEAEAISAVAMA